MSILRKIYKAYRSLRHPLTRRGLRIGMAASYEHEALLAGLEPLRTIVDVGANVGQFALLSRLVQPQAHIHSFEPMSAEANTFRAVLGDDDHVTLHLTALGAKAGEAEINITARADSSSLLEIGAQSTVFPGTHKVGTEAIKVARLEDILEPKQIAKPALLKIDVQGFEGEVLKGCEALLRHFDWIYCEMSFIELYAGQPLACELIPWLAERGFLLATVETDPEMRRNGRAVQADFLFRRTGTD